MKIQHQRVFLAVRMSKEIIPELVAVSIKLKELLPELRVILPGDAHMTLKYFGNCSDEKLSTILERLGSSFPFPPFELALKGVDTFSRDSFHVVWAELKTGEKESHALAEMAHKRMVALSADARLTPHVTLGRFKGNLATAELVARSAGFSSSTMLVDRLFLMKARQGDKSESRYDEIGEIRLG